MRILVTGTGGRSVGSGILQALSEVGDQTKWDVVSADADPFAWGLYKTDESVLIPHALDCNYISTINKVVKNRNIRAIIPGTEPEVAILSRRRSELTVPVIANDHKLIKLMMNKLLMADTLRLEGFNVIDTYDIKQWKIAEAKYGFPLIVKPFKGTGGSRSVHIVTERQEILSIISLSNCKHLCIQPYVGNSDHEYTVGVLTDMKGRLVDSIVIRRKLIGLSLLAERAVGSTKYQISTGYSQGFIIKDKPIQDYCERMALHFESKGPLNIQLRIHKGKPCIFEFHPRFSGTTTIRASAGFNEPDLLLRNMMLGEDISKRIKYMHNVAAIRAFEHVLVPQHKYKGIIQ